MWSKLTSYSDTSFFFVLNNYIILKNRENAILKNGIVQVEDVVDNFIFNNYLLLNKKRDVFIFNIDNNEITTIPNTLSVNTIANDTYYWVFVDAFDYSKLFLIDFKKGFKSDLSINYKYSWEFIFAYKSTIIFFQNSILKLYSISSETIEWEAYINRNGDIFHLLGVRNDELLVLWKRGYDTYGVIGFNIHNGHILWNIDNNPLLNGLTTEFTNNQHSLFSTKGEGGGSYFIELDLNLKQVSRYGDLPGFRQNNLQITWSWVKEDKVYFTALHQSRFANTVGVFDYQTLELIWWETLPLSANDFIGGGESLQIDGDKLYVLDSGGTLHIFERES